MWRDLAFIGVFSLALVLERVVRTDFVLQLGIVLVASVIAYRWAKGRGDLLMIAAVWALWVGDALFGLWGLGMFVAQPAAWTVIVAWITRAHRRPVQSGSRRWVSIGVTAGTCAAVAVALRVAVYYAAQIAISVTGPGAAVPTLDVLRLVLGGWVPICLGIALSLWWIERRTGGYRSEGAERVA